MFKKVLITVLSATMIISSLSSCKKVEHKEVVSKNVSESSSEAPKPTNINPLTGTADLNPSMLNKRPVSFIINNSHSAWPQYGISDADILYEWPYEGSATRIMALFADYTKPQTVGPLRSVRHDFVELSIPYNTVFVHWGGSYAGYNWLENYNINNFDGQSGYESFFRDQNRLDSGYSLEHTGMISTSAFTQTLQSNNIDMNYQTSPAFKFNESETPITFPDTMANSVSVKLSGEVTCDLNYDAATKKYNKSEFGEPQLDASNNVQVSTDNVFILYSNITSFNGDPTLRDLHLEDGGYGYYLTQGTKTKINWTKPSVESPIKYTLENGEELVVNQGKSLIMFAYNEESSNTVFNS